MSPDIFTSTDQEALRRFRDDLYEDYGIYFPEKKFYQLKAKIGKRLRRLGLESVEEYENYLDDNPGEVSDLLDVISTNTTKFYRESKHWEFVNQELISRWEKSRRKVLAWTAACSSGEEPYTLALFLEWARRQGANFDYRILATDLSENVLRRGIKGKYPTKSLVTFKNENPRLVEEFFGPEKGGQREINKEIQAKVKFRKFNLKSSNYLYKNKFDLVILRNVVIYFDNEMTGYVIENLTRSLKSGGHLFTGHSESLSQIDHSLDKIKPAIYQKSV